jgi:hypothetical protein
VGYSLGGLCLVMLLSLLGLYVVLQHRLASAEVLPRKEQLYAGS